MRLRDFSVNICHALEKSEVMNLAADAEITQRLIKVLRYQTVCNDNRLSWLQLICQNSLFERKCFPEVRHPPRIDLTVRVL